MGGIEGMVGMTTEITKEQLAALRKQVGKIGKGTPDCQIIIPGRECDCAPNDGDEICDECVRYAIGYFEEKEAKR